MVCAKKAHPTKTKNTVQERELSRAYTPRTAAVAAAVQAHARARSTPYKKEHATARTSRCHVEHEVAHKTAEASSESVAMRAHAEHARVHADAETDVACT